MATNAVQKVAWGTTDGESISYTRCTVNTTINLHSQSNSLSITHPHNRNHATKRHHRRDHYHPLHHHHRPRMGNGTTQQQRMDYGTALK
ncbi:hypothetical protein V490_06999 [Pseudogymnoascus sp. VKM F-3557]|nr:hypothetical protein V490_06999 [Pseudogymnoascus sp. VKM F-3557]